jgi:hypothetical protein
LIRDSKNTSKPKNSRLSFNGQPLPTGAGGDFDNRYSQRGVQWAVKRQSSRNNQSCTPIPATLYATHLLEDGMDIMTLKDLWDIKC